MKKFHRLIFVFGVIASLSFGCAKADKPMPVTKDNLTGYLQKMESAIKSVSQKDYAEARANPQKQKEVFFKCFVAPMKEMGFSYDKTIYVMADKIIRKETPSADSETASMANEMIMFAIDTKEASFQHGYISRETKELLDKVNPVPAR